MKTFIGIVVRFSFLASVVLFINSLYKMSVHLWSLQEFTTQDYIGLVILYYLLCNLLGKILDKHYFKDEA